MFNLSERNKNQETNSIRKNKEKLHQADGFRNTATSKSNHPACTLLDFCHVMTINEHILKYNYQ